MDALQHSNKRILFNLLPAHVATHFLDNQFRSNMVSRRGEKICVFAKLLKESMHFFSILLKRIFFNHKKNHRFLLILIMNHSSDVVFQINQLIYLNLLQFLFKIHFMHTFLYYLRHFKFQIFYIFFIHLFSFIYFYFF